MTHSPQTFFAKAYLSEIAGETMFRVLARLTVDADRRRCWQLLVGLECQTQQLLLEHAPALTCSAGQQLGARLIGGIYGVVFGLMPSATAMRGLAKAAEPYLQDYARFAVQCRPEDRWIAAYLRDHELAILACAKCACEGRWVDASDAIEQLLLCLPENPTWTDRP